MSRTNPDTRSRILDATIRILEEKGGSGVRMGDIAKATKISRQALYLHFASRGELLIAAARHLDQRLDLERRLAPSRAAATGSERLQLFIEYWGRYIPDIHGVARALLLARHTDEAAAAAWDDRMQAMRDGCRAAINALHADGRLAPPWTPGSATDALWTMLLVPNWEHLTQTCGWSNQQYIRWTCLQASRCFVAPEKET